MGDPSRAKGSLATLTLNVLEPGVGELFQHPEFSLLTFAADTFVASLRNAWSAARSCFGQKEKDSPPLCDIRWRLTESDGQDIREVHGPSASGAAALALLLAPRNQLPDDRLIVLVECRADGTLAGVGNLRDKVAAIAGSGHLDTIVVVGDGKQREAETALGKQRTIRIVNLKPATLEKLVAVRSQLAEAVLDYLDALAAEANKLPAYYPSDARLERVRVRVRVSSERQKFDSQRAAEQERARRAGVANEQIMERAYEHRFSPDGKPEEGPEEPKVRILDWDREVRGHVRRGVVVGDPGLGKTWLLKWEAARYAQEAATQLREDGNRDAVVIPIYRRLSDIAEALANGAATLPDAVIQSLRKLQLPAKDPVPSHRLSDDLINLLRQRLGSDKCLLLLDAFDEVPADRRQPLLVALGDWVPKNPQACILFTSRVVGYSPPWPIPEQSETEREMELMPFDDSQIGDFANAFFAGDPPAAQELREAIIRTPQLRGMAQIPLLLGFLCALHREQRQQAPAQRLNFAHWRRNDLYEAVLRRLLSGAWRDTTRRSAEDVNAKLPLITELAYRLFQEGREQFYWSELASTIKAIWGWSTGSLPPYQEKQVKDKITEMSEEDGLLVKAGAGENPPYLFLHLTFQEYLAACALAGLINDPAKGWMTEIVAAGKRRTVQDLVDHKAWDPRWQEVIVLLAGRLEDPVPLLEMLADPKPTKTNPHGDDYFRHRLALAALCLPEIKELLPKP
ncbi:MAG: NACHT domain-containing protein [Verrucomicrobia bacterium]|nr:NACHT domain-containing protein [Verrucomicrobiota bacterium]